MKTSLVALGIAIVMAGLMIDHGLDVWTAIPVATMILGLLILAVAIVLAERYGTPDDFALAWQKTLGQIQIRLRSVANWFRW